MKLTIITIIMKKTLTTIFFTACALCASATDYYVSVGGGNNENGNAGTADEPWSLAEFQTKCNTSNSSSSFKNGDNIYFASGIYRFTNTDYLWIRLGVSLHGATTADRTIFSGDTNNDGTANLSHLIRITHRNGEGRDMIIENIDFEKFTMNQPYSPTTDTNTLTGGVGAITLYKALAVTIRNCNFRDIINSGDGGSAILSFSSNLTVENCSFKNIQAANRGIAVRVTSNVSKQGTTTFNNCLFDGNKSTNGKGAPCGMVILQNGKSLDFNNCTFINNSVDGNAACIWNNTAANSDYERTLNVTNCLFYNNSSADNNNILVHDNNTYTESGNVNHECGSGISAAINISSVGVGTYYLSLPFTMPKGVIGKTFSSITGSRLTEGKTYKAGDVVPAGTALLVEGAEDTYHPIVAEDNNPAPTPNMLSGSDLGATTTGEGKHYKLANGESGLAFYYGATNGAAFTNAAHKAWLVVPEAQARFFFSFSDDDVTGVERITKQTTPQDGKFMENGRMVILKNGVKYNAVGQKL